MVPDPQKSLDLDELEKIDSICAQFEQSWPDVRIEDALKGASQTSRIELLRSLLVLEFELLARGGNPIDPDAQLARFPDDQEIVGAAIVSAQRRGWISDTKRKGVAETVDLPMDDDTGRDATIANKVSASATASSVQHRQFGRYELLNEIASGGMGIVFKARHLQAGHFVALKLIRPEFLSQFSTTVRDELLARFENEVTALANLEHDHIVTVYDAGQIDGQLYYTMRLVNGKSLSQKLEQGPLESLAAAGYIEQIARALAEVHRNGILHRDMKPQNILIDDKTDRAMLTDFGLAKLLEADQQLTLTQQGIGSPPWMSPEQTLDIKQANKASDIYGLGATLYHALTGRPPFQAANATATAMLVQSQDPISPRELNATVPRDLDTICLKCLEKSPSARYSSAHELADELRHFLRGHPIQARPISRPERAWRWCRRNQMSALLIVAIAVALIVGSVVSISFGLIAQSALNAKEKAEREQVEANRINDRERAATLVDSLVNAPAASIPFILDSLEPLKDQALSIIRVQFEAKQIQPLERIGLACALARFDTVPTNFIVRQIRHAPASHSANMIGALRTNAQEAVDTLRSEAAKCDENRDWRCKARLAMTELHLGASMLASNMCRLSEDPTQRTRLIDEAATWHEGLVQLSQIIEKSNDTELRSALILGLGSASEEQPYRQREIAGILQPLLADWHQNDPDAATHSASGWAMRTWDIPVPVNDPTVHAKKGFGWFINSVGMTIIEIPPRTTLATPDASGGSLLVGDREVTYAQFQRFMNDRLYQESYQDEVPEEFHGSQRNPRNDPLDPVANISWYDAVMYCNWLSRLEQLDPCYRRTGERESFIDENKRESTYDVWCCDSTSNGYRLPTSSEWERACRAGTTTRFVCGDDPADFVKYATCVMNSPGGAVNTGARLCNAWGFFDMHGNLEEWCNDRHEGFKEHKRIYRGGNWYLHVHHCESGSQAGQVPCARDRYRGFRVTRSLAQDDEARSDHD